MRLANVPISSIAALWGTLIMLFGCLCQTCDPGRCDEECERVGACATRFVATGESTYRCYAPDDASCEASRACKENGRCHVTEKGTCVTKDRVESERCAVSRGCSASGACAPMEKKFCAPSEPLHCTLSERCLSRGNCSYTEGNWGMPHCEVGGDADCERSTDCAERGHCAKEKYVCRPAKKAHCTDSARCATHQECTFVPPTFLHQGVCEFQPRDDADCAQNLSCTETGACSYVMLDTKVARPTCEPTLPQHCTQSLECEHQNRCFLELGRIKDGKRYHLNRCVSDRTSHQRTPERVESRKKVRKKRSPSLIKKMPY